jgi:DNA repair protein RadD
VARIHDDPGALAGAAGVVDFIAEGRSDPHSIGGAGAPSLRPYQAAVIERVATEIAAGRRRVLLVAPTGSGKTVIAGALVADAVARNHRVLFLAHHRELIGQASRKVHAAGVDHGIIMPGFPMRLGEPVQVASIASLHARAIRSNTIELPPADLIVVDEAHHCRAQTYKRILEAYPNATIIGLTATPCRGDGRGLGKVFDVIVECPSVAELTAGNYLVPARIYASSQPDLTGVRVTHGDYAEGQLAERVDTPKLIGDVVSHWHRLSGRRRTVLFAAGVAHSLHLRDEFRRSGVLAEHIDGSTPIEEREGILRQLAAGTVELVTNAMVLTEGFDCPEIGCIVLARPTKSLGLYRQMVGRVLRPADGKTDALILDHAGAVFAHGFPDDPIEWTLAEDRRAENKAHASRGKRGSPALVDCPECHAVRFQGQPCPACGWRPRSKPAAVEVAEGDLGRVERDRNVTAVTHDRRRFYAMLLHIAGERGYQRGWAGHKFKEKFGAWPSWRFIDPLPADDEVRSWVRSRAIAYAKAMQKAGAA